jgi:microcystin-dependent protein
MLRNIVKGDTEGGSCLNLNNLMDCYIGMIFPFAGDYAPDGFLPCDGRVLQINSNQALFAVIGNRYGGNGQATFALPDLRGRVPLGVNQGGAPNIVNNYPLAQQGGTETVTLQSNQVPVAAHSHTIQAVNQPATQATAAGAYLATVNASSGGSHPTTYTANSYSNTNTNAVSLAADTVSAPTPSGAAIQPHSNLQPYLAITWMICVNGLFPMRPE